MAVGIREFVAAVIGFGVWLASFLVMYQTLKAVSLTENPVLVVSGTGSMEPGFNKGDLLATKTNEEPFRVGQIVTFKVDGRIAPVTHRIVRVHEKRDTGEVDMLTKGDDNAVDDRVLYPLGQLWLHRKNIVTRIVGYVPYFGMPVLFVRERPFYSYMIFQTVMLYVAFFC